MGTKMAPKYATLTLAFLEENLFEITGKKNSMEIYKEILNWLFHILELYMGRH